MNDLTCRKRVHSIGHSNRVFISAAGTKRKSIPPCRFFDITPQGDYFEGGGAEPPLGAGGV